MSIQTALEEYNHALRLGQKEYSELKAAGKALNPAVLDEILPDISTMSVQRIGVLEIPAEKIIGTKSAGRISAFTPSFRPLLDSHSEFAGKWARLCDAHLGDTGIRDPIVCYEYLGYFYVQEGNKRVSVLRHFEAPRIPAEVHRVMPTPSTEPRIQAYYEFLDFFKATKLYTVQYRKPRDYGKLLSYLGKKSGESWTDAERRSFNTYFQYFRDAFDTLNTRKVDVLPEEALLLWCQLHTFGELGSLTATELKKALAAMWEDVLSAAGGNAVKVQTETQSTKPSLLNRIISLEHIQVAFVHQLNPATSAWALSHEQGMEHLVNTLGEKVTVRSYYDANTPELADALVEQAVQEGAQVVFTTAPLLRRAALKAAVRHPKVQFLNCSVDQPYSSLRSYYGRVYEAKFIAGAIAGALAQNNRIGYVASYPILGEPASINAFALGAQLTNPRAQIELRWSCTEGTPQADFFADGIRVISNREAPSQKKMYTDFCSYGTYLMDSRGDLIPLGTPVWVWGKFYEYILRNIFSGNYKSEKPEHTALNYWLGMDSGVIAVNLSDKLPEGVRSMAAILQEGVRNHTIDPFRRRIVTQNGEVKNDGSAVFTPDQLLHMDWLCDNVIGCIPAYDEILPISRPMVMELGIYRDSIPAVKEA